MSTQYWQIPSSLLAGLEMAINRYLALDSEHTLRLGALAGKIIAVEVTGVNAVVYVTASSGGLQLLSRYEGAPDVVIRGAPWSLGRLVSGSRGRDLLSRGEVEIRGDVELAQRFQQLLAAVDVDWEEQLSRFTGDAAAHQIGNVFRGGMEWLSSALQSFGQDLAEYLQEETHTLPTRLEVEEWLAAVDELRSEADLLEARVVRLRARVAQGAQ